MSYEVGLPTFLLSCTHYQAFIPTKLIILVNRAQAFGWSLFQMFHVCVSSPMQPAALQLRQLGIVGYKVLSPQGFRDRLGKPDVPVEQGLAGHMTICLSGFLSDDEIFWRK